MAYRYFATRTRKFIIADAPGHEQYTRNMVTAAAGSDAAVVLVDIVIGFGAHEDPAGAAARVVGAVGDQRPAVVASVIGTDFDPQHRASQVRKLEQAGILVAPSNARAAELALAISRLR